MMLTKKQKLLLRNTISDAILMKNTSLAWNNSERECDKLEEIAALNELLTKI